MGLTLWNRTFELTIVLCIEGKYLFEKERDFTGVFKE